MWLEQDKWVAGEWKEEVHVAQWKTMEHFQDTDDSSSASAGKGLKQGNGLGTGLTGRH